MLYISLTLSALLLAAVNRIAYRSETPTPWMIGTCLFFLIGPVLLALFLPALIALSLLLIVAVLFWAPSDRGPSFFRSLSFGAMLISLGISGVMVYQAERDYARLRARYPVESMEDRLPVPKLALRPISLVPDTLTRLTRLEENRNGVAIRTLLLKKLHEDAVDLFINSVGFGVTRVPLRPSEWNLSIGRYSDSTPPQPGSRIALESSPGKWLPMPAGDESPLGLLHEVSVRDFAFAWGFGYFKDRRHVAGFESHRFTQVPESGEVRWKLQTLDLVGLILNDEPRVYVSEQLPKMDRRHDTPTRSLDKFEAVALTAIQSGDDLFMAQDGEMARMVGSIRSTNQCVACHGGERGDLLGAFTYTLRRDSKNTADELK